jgi:hypothetical protein
LPEVLKNKQEELSDCEARKREDVMDPFDQTKRMRIDQTRNVQEG